MTLKKQARPSTFTPARSDLAVEGLSKTVGNRVLWADLDLTFEPGSMTAIVGESGAGKTTLLNCISLLETPTSGVVTYGGRRLTRRRRRRLYLQSFGFMFQNFGLVESWTVRENLEIPLRARSVRRAQRDDLVKNALASVGLADRERERVYSLSGGEQQRASFARLLLHRPEVVFVDEPTASLDDSNASRLISLLRGLSHAGVTVILATHDRRVSEEADFIVDLRHPSR